MSGLANGFQVAGELLPLREAYYVTKNRRLVRLIGQYLNGNWYGRFESVSSAGKSPMGLYLWYQRDGSSGSGHSAWDLFARIQYGAQS